MKKILVLILVPISLSGCASVTKSYGPDGKEAYSITCSGMARDWGMCLSKAGDLCKTQGYKILSINGDSGAIININPQYALSSSVINRNILVSCK